ncbi:MAG: hypothetical protein AAB759_01870, partial [Patescibacteria group bacterium]
EQSYEDVSCSNSSRLLFSHDSSNCLNARFLGYCKNVNDSIGCFNLRNKSHHIFNQPYSKSEFEKELSKLDLESYVNLTNLKGRFSEFSKTQIRKAANITNCTNVTGDNLFDSKNCHYCFDLYGKCEDSKYAAHAYDLRDSYDGYGYGANAELLYEGIDTGVDASLCRFASFTHKCRDTWYTYCCHSSSHLFGCVGLRNKEYCILNKQYTKEEYEELLPKIIAQMNAMPYTDKQGRKYPYGEMFPPEFSPFAYNETIAQEYFPLTKNEALKRGYPWKDPDAKDYKITKNSAELPDRTKDIGDDVLKETIGCEHAGNCNHQCTTAFRIISDELSFYRRLGLPVPRLCPNCRNYERFKLRNPMKLWHRKCMCDQKIYKNTVKHEHHPAGPCPNELETPYAPERPEIIYCESCYNAEVA